MKTTRNIPADQHKEAADLLAEWERVKCKKKKEGCPFSQERAAADMGLGTQGNVGHYLHGVNRLSADVAVKFALYLGISVTSFSPRLAKELEEKARLSALVHKFDETNPLGQEGMDAASPTDYRVEGQELVWPQMRSLHPNKALWNLPPTAGETTGTIDRNIEPMGTPRHVLPVISWVQAGAMSTTIDVLDLSSVTEWVPVEFNSLGKNSYALIVKGDSMADRFKPGDRIVVDPDAPWGPGDFVIIGNGEQDEEATFKQIIKDGPDWYMKPLNPQWHVKKLPEEYRVIGRVMYRQTVGERL
ncbi:LexA family transcriptional regulator [Acidithiobacillus ferrivorans]|nr:LexA family transcriptional regulator [Acidithiobacillus ferrivorans]